MTKLPLLIRSSDVNSLEPESQCNCACSNSIATNTQSRPINLNQDLVINPELRYSFLDADHCVVYMPPKGGGENSIGVFNRTTWDILTTFAHAGQWKSKYSSWCQEWGEPIVHNTLDKLSTLGFLQDPKECVLPIVEQPNVLEAWLHITDRCNLRCRYCFLAHERVDMSIETGQSSIDAVFRSAITHQFSKVKLKYAGGEAMLRFPFIVELHKYARNKSVASDIMLDGVILSNGSRLNAEIVNEIQAAGLRLMISLDGIGKIHDQQRPYADGHGSANDVIRGIDLALSCGLIPHISVTVTGQNAHGLPELIEWILDRELPFSVNFYRENDYSASHQDLLINEDEIISGMRAAMNIIATRAPQHTLLTSLIDLADLSVAHKHSCGVGSSYLVFDHLGQISKCHMQMDQPITTNMAEDPLSFIRADTIGIQSLSVEKKSGCNTCEWRYWCTGGCPLATFRATGQYNKKSPNCRIYKELYPELVRLEGLRLLKWFRLSQNSDEMVN